MQLKVLADNASVTSPEPMDRWKEKSTSTSCSLTSRHACVHVYTDRCCCYYYLIIIVATIIKKKFANRE